MRLTVWANRSVYFNPYNTVSDFLLRLRQYSKQWTNNLPLTKLLKLQRHLTRRIRVYDQKSIYLYQGLRSIWTFRLKVSTLISQIKPPTDLFDWLSARLCYVRLPFHNLCFEDSINPQQVSFDDRNLIILACKLNKKLTASFCFENSEKLKYFRAWKSRLPVFLISFRSQLKLR